MKKFILSLMLIILVIFIIGCQNHKKEEVVIVNDAETYNMEYLYQAPETNKKQNLSEVIKIVFTKNDSSLTDTVAIDLEKGEIHVDPRSSGEGIYTTLGTKKIGDAEKALNILEKYKVQKWEKDYTYEDSDNYEDGYGWSLRLQFKDGTVERHKGSGSRENEITPENFDDFFNELDNFVEERLNEEDYEKTRTEHDFKRIQILFKAPEATDDYDFKNIIKVVLRNQDHEDVHTIAINIDWDEIYKDPRVSDTGILPVDGTIVVDDTVKSLEILEKYNVQEWQDKYPNVEQEYQEGYSWNLWLQFDDATVKEYRGAGANRDEILPEDFDALLEELTNFVNDRLEQQDE